jgi:hypothetical protein
MDMLRGLVLVAALLAGVAAFAQGGYQTPRTTEHAHTVALTDAEALLLQTARQAEACLSEAQRAALRANVTHQLEKTRPTHLLDWEAGVMVPLHQMHGRHK